MQVGARRDSGQCWGWSWQREVGGSKGDTIELIRFEDGTEWTIDEIAAQLKVSLSKIKTDISRGRQALKKVLARTMEDRHE